MIALHTVDMWQSVRCYPNVPGNRLSRQRAGPSAEGPFLRRGALPLCRVLPDTLAIPRPLSLQRGIPRQLVLVKNYRRIFARPSRENMAVSFRKIRKKIGILYKILRPARCGQALGGFFLVPAGAGTESPEQGVRHLIWRHKKTDSQTASLFPGGSNCTSESRIQQVISAPSRTQKLGGVNKRGILLPKIKKP